MKTDDKNKNDKRIKDAESDIMLKEIMAKEMKDKLVKIIDQEDPAVINAIKSLLSESE